MPDFHPNRVNTCLCKYPLTPGTSQDSPITSQEFHQLPHSLPESSITHPLPGIVLAHALVFSLHCVLLLRRICGLAQRCKSGLSSMWPQRNVPAGTVILTDHGACWPWEGGAAGQGMGREGGGVVKRGWPYLVRVHPPS